jgi:hypothetical protein
MQTADILSLGTVRQLLSPTIAVLSAVPKTEPQATSNHNSNVFKILLVTTLRTIDLEGKKSSGPLFSRFCVKASVFF